MFCSVLAGAGHRHGKALGQPRVLLAAAWDQGARAPRWVDSLTRRETLCRCVGAPQAIQAIVRQTMGYVDEVPDVAAKVQLIKMLQAVTEGKVSRRVAAAQRA